MTDLKLIALDDEDLAVVSAHLQDAVVKVADLAYLPKERRFAGLLNRFDWAATLASGSLRAGDRRVRSALRFERVLSAKLQNLDLRAADAVLAVLAIGFEPGVAPGGAITIIFAGGAAIRLEVECIEAELKDLGGVWKARARPNHPESDTAVDDGSH